MLRIKIALSMIVTMSFNHTTETVFGALNWSVNKGKLCDVVFVDHTQHGLWRLMMHLRFTSQLLVGRLEFSESIVRNEPESFLLWSAVDHTKRFRNTTRVQATQINFFLTFLKNCHNFKWLTILISGLSWCTWAIAWRCSNQLSVSSEKAQLTIKRFVRVCVHFNSKLLTITILTKFKWSDQKTSFAR